MYSRDRLIKAIDNSACLTRRQIDDYLQNKLFPEELYVVEMHLNECPFCNDAIEGYGNMPNANSYLSKAESFIFPTAASGLPTEKIANNKTTKAESKPVSKQNTSAPKPEKKKEVSTAQQNSFQGEKKKKRFSIPMGIAAGVALAIGVWGISSLFNGNKAEDMTLSDAAIAANTESEQDGMFNESSINRKEDSLMNAKYGYQNQAPLASSAKGVEYIRSRQNADAAESEGGMSMADDIQEATAPAASVAAEKPAGFIGPVMPKEEESKRSAAAVEKAKPVAAAKTTTTAPTVKTKTADESKAKTVAANSKETAKTASTTAAKADVKEAPKKETAKKDTDKKTSAADPVITQAEKDFSKGMDLYNKKQYSASIMYFQSAAKVKEFPKRKQAESYIKLAKGEVVNAERKKNSENK